jgi:hypothetical protein
MLGVKAFYSVGGGTPNVSGLDWRPAVLTNVERTDPFTKKPIVCPVWAAVEDAPPRQRAEVFCQVDLTVDAAWAPARATLAAQSATLHDGLIVELWSLVIGEREALSAWRPTWVTPDGDSQLIAFPDVVTRWLGNPQAPPIASVVGGWEEMGYLGNVAGSDGRLVAESLIHLLGPMARTTILNGATLLAFGSGYALP